MKKLFLLLIPITLLTLCGCSVNCYPNNDEDCFIDKCREIVRECNNCGYSEKIQGGIYINNCGDYLDMINGIE